MAWPAILCAGFSLGCNHASIVAAHGRRSRRHGGGNELSHGRSAQLAEEFIQINRMTIIERHIVFLAALLSLPDALRGPDPELAVGS